jgi:hypothetical protein
MKIDLQEDRYLTIELKSGEKFRLTEDIQGKLSIASGEIGKALILKPMSSNVVYVENDK